MANFDLMKGLEEYINIHGNHFTESLALTVTNGKWDSSRIIKTAQKKVYYNVTASTLGDMVYLTNKVYMSDMHLFNSMNKCIDYMLNVIGNYAFYDGIVFKNWLKIEELNREDIDFSKYI